MKRVVVILGAGASVEFGAPATSKLTENIEQRICSDEWMRHQDGDAAFRKIKEMLSTHLTNPANYEQIYHCVHELIHFFPLSERTVDEYRPLLMPFIQNNSGLSKSSLEALDREMLWAIYQEIFVACKVPKCSLNPFRDFLQRVRERHILRIYSTNHDDFPLQAVEDLYTGFELTTSNFDPEGFWGRWDCPAIFHLHGSVHMGFGDQNQGHNIDQFVWYEDREEAYRHTKLVYASNQRRQDGGQVARFPLVTGVDKLSNIQQRPYCYYYAALARDLLEADLIYVIGSGLGDLHINTWLHEARSRKQRTPLLFIDCWPDGFINERFELEPKPIEMIHSLNIYTDNLSEKDYGGTAGWTVSQDCTAAVWDQGFQKFLATPDALNSVLKVVGFQ